MTIGWPKDKASIDNMVGDLATTLSRAMRRGLEFKTGLDAYTDQQLTNAGYAAGEVTALRNFASDLQQIAQIYQGSAALASAKDFRPTSCVMWGILGDT